MESTSTFNSLVGQPESSRLEYKATLIPSRAMAQILAGFANSEGGTLILGVREQPPNRLEVQGLSNDFNVQGILSKALNLITPSPSVRSEHFQHQGKTLFGIEVEKSPKTVLVEAQEYIRTGAQTIHRSPKPSPTSTTVSPRFQSIFGLLVREQQTATDAKKRLLIHYQNIFKLYEPALSLFPPVLTELTTTPEGKILNRILFSSCVDNFETYLSDLLYQIYLARSETLKAGDSQVRVADVLERTDIEDFVQWFASKRVSKLQKGSIKGFLNENPEIEKLKAITSSQLAEIEKILQIRHLYSHRNGIVDEAFLYHFRGQFTLNAEHQLSIQDVLDKLEYLVGIVSGIDSKAAAKYGLSTKDP